MNDRNIGIDYNNESWNIVNNNGYFNIYDNSTNQIGLSISPSGNVGIGSTEPKSKLDITGAVNILGIATISSNVQFGTNDNIANNIYIIREDASTRIGIGTRNPTANLDIIGDANITGLFSVGGAISINSETSIIPIAQIGTNIDETSNLYFIGGGTSRIGIGNKTPNYALDIIGDVNITGIYKKNNRDIIQDTSNYVETTSNIFVGKISDTSNYLETTSNIFVGRISDTSNYVETTSNILSGRISDTSNYVETTSNIFVGLINDSSNYVEITSNILTGRISDTSNYVETTSNILADRISDTSNYVETTSNILAGRISDTSNYVEITSNILVGRISDTSNYVGTTSNIFVSSISDTSNYVETTSNIISKDLSLLNCKLKLLLLKVSLNTSNISQNDINTSNYIASINSIDLRETSNIISERISSLTTDMINEPQNANKKFIINNIYNSNLEINGNLLLQSNLNINGNVNFKGKIYKDGVIFPSSYDSTTLHKYCPIQAHYNIYKKTEEKTKPGWQFIDENIDSKIIANYNNGNSDTFEGFCIRIKPNYNSTKILINLNCHIGIDNGLDVPQGAEAGVDARVWGLRLYRKIGIYGEWEHVSGADGEMLTIPGISGGIPLTRCWISHNLGTGLDNLSALGIVNMSGTYYDESIISYDYIYYTAKWCSILGVDNYTETDLYTSNLLINGKLYLNRPALIYRDVVPTDEYPLNSPIVSSSWNAIEIWQGDLTNIPKGGFIAKYAPMQTEVNIYTKTFEKKQTGWEFIGCETDSQGNALVSDNDDIKDFFCVRIRPTHSSSKILIKLNCNIGIGGSDSAWWGIRLWRRIGDDGEWEHLTSADGDILKNANNETLGTSCWISNTLGAYSDSSAQTITNICGTYYDSPDVGSGSGAGVYVYYAAKWSSLLGNEQLGGKLYLNRPEVIYDDDNEEKINKYINSQITSSSWNATEIWQQEVTFIPSNVLICNNMSIQTLFNIYRDIVSKSGYGWQFIDNNIKVIKNQIKGFCIRIKLTHSTSKVLLNLSCHIGIDYGTNAKWWGLRLYRKIGINGEWVHISDADGNNLTDNKGTSCWLSHNLGADTSISSYFVANITGSYCDVPGTSSDYVYYTVKWCAILGDVTLDSKLYLNRPAYYNNNNSNNSAVLSSSWCAQEIWQLGTPYLPKEADNTFFKIYNNDTIGLGVGDANGIYKLDVNGSVNANKYYNIAIDTTPSTNIVYGNINNSLELINSINPIYYIENDNSSNYAFNVNNIQEKLPELVNYTVSLPQKITIEYMSLIPLLTRSIQELSEKINEQQEEIRMMKLQLSPDELGAFTIISSTE